MRFEKDPAVQKKLVKKDQSIGEYFEKTRAIQMEKQSEKSIINRLLLTLSPSMMTHDSSGKL